MRKKPAVKKSDSPQFDADFCVSDRCIAADSFGNLWVIDPKKGIVTPVKVKTNAR